MAVAAAGGAVFASVVDDLEVEACYGDLVYVKPSDRLSVISDQLSVISDQLSVEYKIKKIINFAN